MGLPWVRLDANIAVHDKIMHLYTDPAKSKRGDAAALYMFGLAWSGGAGTDGHIPSAMLPVLHGDGSLARLLVKYGLWDEATAGYQIRNYSDRQQMSAAAEARRHAQQNGGVKGACIRLHGKDCGCWKTAEVITK